MIRRSTSQLCPSSAADQHADAAGGDGRARDRRCAADLGEGIGAGSHPVEGELGDEAGVVGQRPEVVELCHRRPQARLIGGRGRAADVDAAAVNIAEAADQRGVDIPRTGFVCGDGADLGEVDAPALRKTRHVDDGLALID